MNESNYEIASSSQPISKSGITVLLNDIRPVWRSKNLIQRVERLLPIDPSSACQRLFNAAIHDLKEKIIIMGLDLAKDIASNYRLPPLSKEEDVLDYNVSKTIDLAYRMGILSRAEWRRIHRCYEIRRDLEHEDEEYEAVLEDCFYIFKTSIDVVLSRDAIELLRVKDAKELIESSSRIALTEEFLTNYSGAPKLRQQEITDMLVSHAQNDTQPDVVRENSVELLRHIRPITNKTVTIDIASNIEKKLGKTGLDIKTAKIACACGAIGYFKKARIKDFYASILVEVKKVSSWQEQSKISAVLEDIGGLQQCPTSHFPNLLEELVLWYIGEPGYGRYSSSRPVFYSNGAAPIVKRMIESDRARALIDLELLRNSNKVKSRISNKHILRRFEELVDSCASNNDS